MSMVCHPVSIFGASSGVCEQFFRGKQVPQEQLLFIRLDTSSLKSVRAFAETFQKTGLDLHLLVLNAGVALG